MKFVSLHLNNWLPYRGEQHLEFPMDDHRNILVIFGENMNGKTSLLNAVRWALYGKARNRQKRVIADKDLMNIDALKNGENSFWVKLALEADGSEYLIDRRVTLKDGLAKPVVILKRDNRVVDGNLVEGIINGLVAEQISQFLLFDGASIFQILRVAVKARKTKNPIAFKILRWIFMRIAFLQKWWR